MPHPWTRIDESIIFESILFNQMMNRFTNGSERFVRWLTEPITVLSEQIRLILGRELTNRMNIVVYQKEKFRVFLFMLLRFNYVMFFQL